MRRARSGLVIGLLISSIPMAVFAQPRGKLKDVEGPVQSVKTWRATLSQDEEGKLQEGPRVRSEERTYNEAGQFTEQTFYDASGTLINRTVLTYDKSGALTATERYGATGSLMGKERLRYDGQGREVERVQLDAKENDTVLGKTVSVYDRQGRLTEVASYEGKKTLLGKTAFTYDQQGNQTEAVSSDANGTPLSRTVSVYDANGREKESAAYDAKGILLNRVVSTYDKKGSTSTITNYSPDGAVGGKLVSRYDTQGNQLEGASYDAAGSLTAKEAYTFEEVDQQGNWTKRATAKFDPTQGKKAEPVPVEVLHRSIAYASEQPQPKPEKPGSVKDL